MITYPRTVADCRSARQLAQTSRRIFFDHFFLVFVEAIERDILQLKTIDSVHPSTAGCRAGIIILIQQVITIFQKEKIINNCLFHNILFRDPYHPTL